VCVAYEVDGKRIEHWPDNQSVLHRVRPVYEELPGWRESTVGVTEYDALPVNARKYLERLQALVNVPIDMISTGPDRDQTIVLRHPFGV